MPSIASNNTSVKLEKVSVLDLPESFKSANTVIEKKCRNLEKRKVTSKLFHFLFWQSLKETAVATRGRHAGFLCLNMAFIILVRVKAAFVFMLLTCVV